jgi:hypothetical protein
MINTNTNLLRFGIAMRVMYNQAKTLELMFWPDKGIPTFTKIFLTSMNG